MNRKEKALVMGFVEYLQGVYGEDGERFEAFTNPPNSLLVPMFVDADPEDAEEFPDFGAVGSAMAQPDMGALMAQINGLSPMQPDMMGADMGMGMDADPMMDPAMMDPAMMGMMG
jgi:hypothetical protein